MNQPQSLTRSCIITQFAAKIIPITVVNAMKIILFLDLTLFSSILNVDLRVILKTF